MKRVKIMLSAILVLAVVAGALAFKVKKSNGFCLYKTTTTEVEGDITCKLQGRFTTTPELNGGIIVKGVYTTTTLVPCGNLSTYTPTDFCTKTLTTIAE